MVGFFEELSAAEVELVQQLKAEVASVVQVRERERARLSSQRCQPMLCAI